MSFASQTGQWTLLAPILPVVVDAAAKSALVLIAAGVAVGCMRKCSAAARHLVWFLAVASLPLLPVLSLALPGWHILPRSFNVQPTITAQRIAPAAETVPAPSPSQSSAGAVAPAEAGARIEPQEFQSTRVSSGERSKFKSPMPSSAASTPLPPRQFNLPAFVLPLWIAGAVLTLLPTALGLFSLWRLERSSRRETASSWLELLRQLVDRLNFRRAVALLKTNRRRMPMTWGILRPKLLLPEESHEWPAERRSVVLLHELAHAKRWDYLTNLVTQFVCALYWFNPLVWFAARRMIAERERACDDIVLRHGARPADYAEQILQIAAGLRLERWAGYGGIAMARPSKLEGRLRAILDAGRNRAALTRFIVLVAIVLLVVVIIPIAMMKAVSGETSNRIAAGPTGIAPTSSPPAFATSTSYPRLITGHVVDADTQKPIPEFTVTPGSPAAPDLLNWDRANATTWKNSPYQFTTRTDGYPTLLLVEAPGYAPEMAPIRINSILDFRLRKGGVVEGTVLDPAGRPVANAQILFHVKYSLANLDAARFRYPFWIVNSPNAQRSPESFTDSDGRFSLPATAGAVSFLAVHESGFVEQSFPLLPLGSNTTIRLRPWARIEGTLFRGAQPLTNDSVSLSSSNYWSQGFELRVSDTNGWFSTACRADTDGSGHFVFDRVPPGEFHLDWTDPIPGKQVPRWPVKTEAGKTAVVELNILNGPRPQTATDGEVERKGNLEELKRFLTSPPPLEYVLYYVTNDPASRFRLSSRTRQEGTVAAEWPIDIFEGSWCHGNFWTRRLGPGSTSPLGPVFGAFVGRSGDTHWHVVGSTVFKQTVREREPEYLGPIGYAYPARPGEQQFLRILTLGIPVAKPGTFQFDGNRFIVDRDVGPKEHGELLTTNGWVTGIRLEWPGSNRYLIFEFTYDRRRDPIPWFYPSEITQKVYDQSGKLRNDGYHAVFLKLQIADRELPASRFLSEGIVVPAGATNPLAGLTSSNPAYFLVGPDGKLIQTNSKVFFPGQGGGAPFESVGGSKAGFTNARPFTVKGRVTDPQGNGIAGVTITAHCGMGTLFPTGETNTDAEGRYVLRFREGMKGFDESSGQWRVAVQAATIAPRKAGWFETNLYRGGDLLMADKLPAPDEKIGWKLDPAKVVLPDRPYELNFVMQPAARIVGQLSDELERPMARTKIWIDGELPPSSSVLAETETDAAGRFRFEDVPTGYFWNFNIASAAGMTTRFESPGELSLYLRVRDSRGRKVLGPVAPPGETMNADTQSRTSTPPSIEISLGLRSVTGIEFRGSREFKYPLAFRVKNVGQTALSGREIPQLLFDAVLHARSADGVDRTNAFRQFWMGFAPQDLAPGEMYEDWINGDLLTYFSSVSNGVYEVWWTLRDLKSNSLRFEVAKGEMRLVTDPVVVSSAVPPQLIERPPQPKGAGAVSVRDRIEQLIRSAPVTTNFDLEIWEPGARNAFTIRSNVVQLAYYNEGGLDSNSVFGMVYHLPAQNRFYVGWDAFRSEPRHYYGPFTGNPFEVLGARSGNAWEQDAHRPDSKRVEPDNPLGLDDETLVRLFNLGKKLQQVAWNIALPPSNSKIVFHSVDEVYTNYINRDELGSDPFGSGTLRLERTGSKVHIYSVGPDGEWNRGELIQPGDAELKGDLGVEVEIGKSDIHWLAEGALLDYLQGKHTARYLAKKGTHYAVQFPLPGWADEKLKFGPMTDGLRAAVELTATKGRFVFGQPIGVRFHIRNEADYAIQITSASWRNEDKAIIEDEQGKTRPTGHIMYIGTSAQVRKILKPGETATFQSSSLEFFTEENAQSANAVRHPVGYTVTLKPGKCTIRFRLRLPGWNAQLMDWQGELETGPVVLDLKPLSEASTGQGTEGRKLFALSALSAVKFSSDSP